MPGRETARFPFFLKTLILVSNLMSDKNTESVLYVQIEIVIEISKIRDLKLVNEYKGYEQNILRFLKTSF